MIRISAKNLKKEYFLKKRGFLGEKKTKVALSDVSFCIYSGETVGIIGRNGSGKSTLLKIICSITKPTDGKIMVDGRISALLELGAGFHPEYSGIENIYLSGNIMGLTKNETKKIIPQILQFADIGEYAYQPVRTYSDGMFLRLAFAVAICSQPDILIIDEALAVGDFLFRAKCYNKIMELKKKGITILLVTHDNDAVRKICDRAIWIDKGKIIADGDVQKVTSAYMEAKVTGECLGINGFAGGMINRFGSFVGAIEKVECPEIWKYGENVTIRIYLNLPLIDEKGLNLSVSVRNLQGLDILVIDAEEGGAKLVPNAKQWVEFKFKNQLISGEYFLAIGLENREDNPISYYDYCDGAAVVKVDGGTELFGIFHTKAEVKSYGK